MGDSHLLSTQNYTKYLSISQLLAYNQFFCDVFIPLVTCIPHTHTLCGVMDACRHSCVGTIHYNVLCIVLLCGCHRNLTARNCLMGNGYLVKVTIFKLRQLMEDDIYVAPVGTMMTIKWAAPETLLYDQYSTKSDIWCESNWSGVWGRGWLCMCACCVCVCVCVCVHDEMSKYIVTFSLWCLSCCGFPVQLLVFSCGSWHHEVCYPTMV